MIIEVGGTVIRYKVFDDYGQLDLSSEGGIGYRILVPANYPITSEGTYLLVHTSFQVKEDSQSLYGFSTPDQRDFFETLISVSGVGPKIGLSILSMYGSDKVKELILAADHASLSKVKGLGPKGSKKIILELAGILSSVETDPKESDTILISELRDALKTLGFVGVDVKNMVEKGESLLEKDPDMTIEDLIQKVLRGEP